MSPPQTSLPPLSSHTRHFYPPRAGRSPRHSGPRIFKGTDSNGVQHSLSEYRGKLVVREWANQGCPYDRSTTERSIESQQRDWTAKRRVWLTVISSAPRQRATSRRPKENTYLKTMHPAPPPRCSTPPARSPASTNQDHAPHLRHRPNRQAHLSGRARRQTNNRQADLRAPATT